MHSLTELRPYQHRMVEFATGNMNCALWVGLGLGKTVATLTAIARLKEMFEVNKALVVAPLRVARKVWIDEVKQWAHLKQLKVSIICGTPKQRLKALHAEADIYCVNNENFVWLCNQFIIRDNGRLKQTAKWPWDTVVLDESDSFKSQSAERWKWAKRVRRLFPRMIQLTGTPASNGYQQIWAQIYLLDGGQRLGSSEQAFKERFMDPPSYGEYGWQMKPSSELVINQLVKDIVISLREEDYLDLPPIVYNFIGIELPKDILAKIAKLEKEFIVEIVPDKKLTAVNSGVLYGKLLQLASGAVYRQIDETEDREVIQIHDEKVLALIEKLDALPTPLMITYTYQHERDRIQTALKAHCKKSGHTSRILKTEQDEIDWNAGKIDYLLLHPKSAGHGCNLQFSGAENIIWFGPTANRALYDQLNARLAGGHRRKGKNIVIHHLIAEGTIDELRVIPKLSARGEAEDVLLRLLSDKVRNA